MDSFPLGLLRAWQEYLVVMGKPRVSSLTELATAWRAGTYGVKLKQPQPGGLVCMACKLIKPQPRGLVCMALWPHKKNCLM